MISVKNDHFRLEKYMISVKNDHFWLKKYMISVENDHFWLKNTWFWSKMIIFGRF